MSKTAEQLLDGIIGGDITYGVVSLADFHPEYSFIVMLFPYTPFGQDGDFWLDSYYLTSNDSYHRFKDIKAKLGTVFQVVEEKLSLDYKRLAHETGLGGSGAFNSLCYNASFGSYFNIQIITVRGQYNIKRSQSVAMRCATCGACVKACPTGAVRGDGTICREKCLREVMNHPEDLDDVTSAALGNRVLGCTTCQKVCPHNKHIKPQPYPSHLEDVLTEVLRNGDVSALSAIIGTNSARKTKILNMLINAAGNAGKAEYIPLIEQYQSVPELSGNADTALKKLRKV